MIDLYLSSGASMVRTGALVLYNGVPASSPITLTGSLPAVAFRCAVTVSAATGHSDVAGSVVVGGETLTFTVAARKTTTLSLTALPVVTYSGLDCNIRIEVLNLSGQPLFGETVVAIDTRIEPHQSYFQNSSGTWEVIRDTQIFSDTDLDVGDIVRKGTRDYIIKQIDENAGLDGEIEFYTYLA